jgi:hypothetical protein
MTGRIRAAGGITCDYALDARTLLSGGVELADSRHRWAVADELGIGVVPVEMRTETEPAWGGRTSQTVCLRPEPNGGVNFTLRSPCVYWK